MKINTSQIAFYLAIITLISKCLGFVREMVLANYFGASYIVDAYVLAQSIPNMIFGGLVTAIGVAFIPLYSKKYEQNGIGEANLFMNKTINTVLLVAVVSAVVGLLFSKQIVTIFASGFTGEAAELTAYYIKVTFVLVLFTAAASVWESYLKYHNVFLSPAIAGFSVSIFSVIFIVIGAFTNHYYIIYGILVGNMIRSIIIYFIARKHGYRHKYDFHLKESSKEILAISLPVFVGASAEQINNFVDKTLATWLPEGSASSLNYGNLVVVMITGISSTVIVTILYPKLAQAYAQKDESRFSSLFNSGLSILSMIGFPFTLGAVLYGDLVIQIIYERGEFDTNATAMTTTAFLYYSVGLAFVIVNAFLIQAFYSRHNTKTPLIISLLGVVVNSGSSILLVQFMGLGGLALGTSISAGVSSILLLVFIHKGDKGIFEKGFGSKIIKILISSIVSVGISYLAYMFISNNIWMPRTILMAVIVLIAGVIYLTLLKLFKIEELIHLRQIFTFK